MMRYATAPLSFLRDGAEREARSFCLAALCPPGTVPGCGPHPACLLCGGISLHADPGGCLLECGRCRLTFTPGVALEAGRRRALELWRVRHRH